MQCVDLCVERSALSPCQSLCAASTPAAYATTACPRSSGALSSMLCRASSWAGCVRCTPRRLAQLQCARPCWHSWLTTGGGRPTASPSLHGSAAPSVGRTHPQTQTACCSHVLDLGLIEARAIPQSECFDAALKFAKTEVGVVAAPRCPSGMPCTDWWHRTMVQLPWCSSADLEASSAALMPPHTPASLPQGIVPAPEPTHALAEAVAEALRCKCVRRGHADWLTCVPACQQAAKQRRG